MARLKPKENDPYRQRGETKKDTTEQENEKRGPIESVKKSTSDKKIVREGRIRREIHT